MLENKKNEKQAKKLIKLTIISNIMFIPPFFIEEVYFAPPIYKGKKFHES